MKPPDLKRLFGDRYRIVYDEAAERERALRRDPWYWRVKCRRGHIYPHSDRLLGFWCTGSPSINKLRRQHPELTISQLGDDEAIFLFSPAQIDIIAPIAQPYRKRQIGAAERKRLTAQLQSVTRKNKAPNSLRRGINRGQNQRSELMRG